MPTAPKKLYQGTDSLQVDWYQRHPKFGHVVIHCLQLDEDGTVLGGLDEFQAPIEEVDSLIESAEIVGMDAGVAAWVQQQTGVQTAPEPVPAPPEAPSLPEPAEPAA